MSSPVSVRLSADLVEKLSELAEATERPKSWHIEKAVQSYLEVQQWQIAHIKKAMEMVEAGKFYSHEQAVQKMKRLTASISRNKKSRHR